MAVIIQAGLPIWIKGERNIMPEYGEPNIQEEGVPLLWYIMKNMKLQMRRRAENGISKD